MKNSAAVPSGAAEKRLLSDFIDVISLADSEDVKTPTAMMSILLATPKSNKGGSPANTGDVKPPMMTEAKNRRPIVSFYLHKRRLISAASRNGVIHLS